MEINVFLSYLININTYREKFILLHENQFVENVKINVYAKYIFSIINAHLHVSSCYYYTYTNIWNA